jgi:quinol monooxygenase YgiN
MMFVIMYEFTVKKDETATFKQLWHELTLRIRELSNSLGSRLHQESDTTWIGYAQWPSRAAWEDSNLNQAEMTELRQQIFEACEDIQIIHQLDVVDDLLVQARD